MRTIATVPGTGTDIVKVIARALNADLWIIRDRTEAKICEPDYLLLLGGRDINPAWYGEERYTTTDTPDKERDSIEWSLLRRAMTRGIPIMGICRGMQMIAVAHGAALWQDMKLQGAAGRHPSEHKIKASGPLSKYIPTDWVNSRHHQALRSVPASFKVLATAPDGVIESIWRPGTLGVQWHPELLFPEVPAWMGLFRWFLDGLN